VCPLSGEEYYNRKDWKHFDTFNQVVASAEEITASVQTEAENVRQLSVMAQELNNLASRLNQDVGVFRLKIENFL